MAQLLLIADDKIVLSSPLPWAPRNPSNSYLALSSYGRFGAVLYPAWTASCSVMYLPFLVVP
jgi:hypothetical protein